MLASDGIKIHIHESSRNDSLRGIRLLNLIIEITLYYIILWLYLLKFLI